MPGEDSLWPVSTRKWVPVEVPTFVALASVTRARFASKLWLKVNRTSSDLATETEPIIVMVPASRNAAAIRDRSVIRTFMVSILADSSVNEYYTAIFDKKTLLVTEVNQQRRVSSGEEPL